MGIIETIAYFIIAFFWGVVCTIIVEFYLFKKYLYSGPMVSLPKSPVPPGHAELPDTIIAQVGDEKFGQSGGTSSPRHGGVTQGNENLAINLTLQFLFNELRNAERVRLWFYRKLNNEFKELLTQSTTGKFFESAQLRDLNLGNHFPTIKGLDVADAKISADTGLLETLDLSLDLHYSGNFQMSVDLKMLLGKSAYLSLQVKRLTGKARLQFTRVPYTHWSLSFYSEPILELAVTSQFQGRQLQPQIISLITSQIRRAVRRKHTLPRYKMRYKPFFRRLNDEEFELPEAQSIPMMPGYLDITLVEVSRLNVDSNMMGTENSTQIDIYCTMSIDATPWVYLTQYMGVPYMVLDLIVTNVGSHLGVTFKQDQISEIGQQCILVENVIPGTPAGVAELKKGDIVAAVNSKKITGINQLQKLIKNAAQKRFVIRIERKYVPTEMEKCSTYKVEFDRFSEKYPSKKVLQSDGSIVEESYKTVKFSDFPDFETSEADNRVLRRRKSTSQLLSTDDNSPTTPSTEQQQQQLGTPSRQTSYASLASCISNCAQPYCSGDCNIPSLNELYYTTMERDYSTVVTFDEKNNFYIESELQYLNIGVWGKVKDSDNLPKLLGYLNVPIKLILSRCSTSITGHYLKCHPLSPPDSALSAISTLKLTGYSGFDPTLCYGDILLSYVWITCRPKPTAVDITKKSVDDPTVKAALISGDQNKRPHDFIRTHFNKATHCDFCTKKIWLKDAVQCRNCDMVCHKKCETRCQAAGPCSAEIPPSAMDESDDLVDLGFVNADPAGPEISFTGCDDTQGKGMASGLKKAGSTSCLTPPNSGSGLSSRSLPPSPCASRKVDNIKK